ncbi:hypothetical protein QQ045_020493 [Rhodiola kirilowii]
MEDAKTNDDQRIKNRERQRRYRARKRLEADSTKADTTIQQPQAFIVMPEAKGEEAQKELTRVPAKDMSRTYCKRDWKRDARLAHLSRQPASGSTSSTNSPAGSSFESVAPHLLLQLRGESLIDSGFHVEDPSSHDDTETKTSAPIRRDWKAEARNKTK